MKLRFVVLACALLLSACDSSHDRYDRAVAKYKELIIAQRPLKDPAYDALLTDLDDINNGTAQPQAKRLADAIRSLRQPRKLPPRPLAVATGDGDDAVEIKARECAELAKAIGLAADGGRQAAIDRLAGCRRELSRLDVARVHAQDPLGGAGHGHGDEGHEGHGADAGAH